MMTKLKNCALVVPSSSILLGPVHLSCFLDLQYVFYYHNRFGCFYFSYSVPKDNLLAIPFISVAIARYVFQMDIT